MNILLYAVPFFLLLIALELIVDKWRGTNYYRVNDSLTSLTTGTINQLVAVSKRLIPFTIYVMVYDSVALFSWPDSAWGWIIAFIVYDFFYYWKHRMGHEMNILWASHVVHHSSEEYNLTTALRQTGTGFLGFIFYLPMAVMGIDPLMLVTVGALNLVYQFWVHTRHVGKLGWVEWFFVTPSNHRGHHAQNTVYIDRNYGGVFILWDRFFGTYQEEQDDDLPVYGIRGAVRSWNPLWVNFQIYNQLFWDAVHTKNWWHKLTLWFRRTGWRPPDVVDQYPLEKNELEDFEKFDIAIPGALKIYSILQYSATATLGVWFGIVAADLAFAELASLIGFVLFSSFAIGSVLENRHYAGVLEWMRIAVLFTMALLSPIPIALSIGLCSICVISAPFLLLGRHQAMSQVQALKSAA
ncbi:sterol desaturase family protein [Arenicella xantha]|uniref:Sterol desaturase/sphingolipid hydroxylase (Fatty acid hydroxylase superfamily) n=1 Tax=Arenicella xantha TaxID=644221 RepID=A0A395JK32_9GAMM|nr:sterol desaturase family protein [Arenicella xantha]RBP50775.1 sterol desaturase/sphingolipid hydroxylase (fatty acid hydroxylase superfamily) [Arenicella xantha]